MATQLNLANLVGKDPYIDKIVNALEQGTGQRIIMVNVMKVKRVSGTSVAPVELVFSGNQKVTLYVRASADVFKAELNGKVIPLAGDFSNSIEANFKNGVESVAKAVRGNQKKFEAQQQKTRVIIPKKPGTAPVTTANQLKQVQQVEQQLDQQITELTGQRDSLLSRLNDVQQFKAAEKGAGQSAMGKSETGGDGEASMEGARPAANHLATVKITDDHLKDLPSDLKDTEQLKKLLLAKLRGEQPVTNKASGKKIVFTRSGIQSSLKMKNPLARKIYLALPDLLTLAQPIDHDPNRKAEKAGRIKGYDRYAVKVNLDGRDYLVKIKVEVPERYPSDRYEKQDSYYFHSIEQIEIA